MTRKTKMAETDIQKLIAEFEAKMKPVTPEILVAAKSAKKKKTDKKAEKAELEKLKKIQQLKGDKILVGIAASPRMVIGMVRNVHAQDPQLMAQLEEGEVMVSDRTEPGDLPYMKRASAFVTDSGGKTCSTAMVARGMGKPAVTGTLEGTQSLKNGQKVVVDGIEGAVYKCIEAKLSRLHKDFTIQEIAEYKSNKDVAGLIGVLKFSKSKSSIREAIKALVEIGDTKTVDALIAILKNEDESDEFRGNVAETLGRIASDKAIIALIAALGDWYYVMREKASLTLREAGEPTVPLLISALSNEDPTIRAEVVAILGNMGTKKAIEPLIVRLRDKNEIEIVRTNAGEALVQIGDRNKLIEPLTVVLEEGIFNISFNDARQKAIETLVKIRDSRAVVPLLIKVAMESIVDRATGQAIIALGNMRDSQAVDPLIELLEDKSSENLRKRGLAAEALGKIGSAKAVEPLVRVLEDGRENPWVKDNAAQALRKILKGIENTISKLIKKAGMS